MPVSIRELEERDLPAADRICRLAFGTFLGLPDPMTFMGDADFVATRWRTEPSGAIAAELDGELVGSNLVARWGSFGFFGPLSVRPDLWDRGIARLLLERTMEIFAAWGTTHHGLFTFAQSAKHVGLYRKFGFAARFLTAVMSRPVQAPRSVRWSRLSKANDRDGVLRACRSLTTRIHPGLDLEHEISAVARQSLGDTVLLHDGGELAGLAVCHCGARTEAGTATCYVKFAAVRPGPDASARFERLLDACDAFAGAEQARTLVAGVNMARDEAYGIMLARGFRTFIQGVAMQKPNDAGFNRPDAFVIADWR